MLKNSEISTSSPSRTHRTYSAQFKAELVVACGQPGVSIAALAGQHGMNANVLHRWLKEHALSGCHGQSGSGNAKPSSAALQQHTPAFIAVQLPAPGPEPASQAIKVEIRKGALTMTITWPGSASLEFASWAASILQ